MRHAVLFFACLLPCGVAATEKGTQFWNLASKAVTHLELAPAGSGAYGPDQARNDPDGTVDPDERVKIVGVETGRYDARIAYKGGQTCVVKNIAIENGKIFSVDAKALTACSE
jgi:hypothetical protein